MQALVSGQTCHRTCIFKINTDRFFNDQVFSGIQAINDVLIVHLMWGRDLDYFKAGVAQHIFVVADCLSAKGCFKRATRCLGWVRACNQANSRMRLQTTGRQGKSAA